MPTHKSRLGVGPTIGHTVKDCMWEESWDK
jgi:hypothetical protein